MEVYQLKALFSKQKINDGLNRISNVCNTIWAELIEFLSYPTIANKGFALVIGLCIEKAKAQ
jgi:hypothetical protein